MVDPGHQRPLVFPLPAPTSVCAAALVGRPRSSPQRPACARVPVAVARGLLPHLSQEGGPAPGGRRGLQLPALAARPGEGAAGGRARPRGGACSGAWPGGGGDPSRANERRGHEVGLACRVAPAAGGEQSC